MAGAWTNGRAAIGYAASSGKNISCTVRRRGGNAAADVQFLGIFRNKFPAKPFPFRRPHSKSDSFLLSCQLRPNWAGPRVTFGRLEKSIERS
jgi:hypothetical protein